MSQNRREKAIEACGISIDRHHQVSTSNAGGVGKQEIIYRLGLLRASTLQSQCDEQKAKMQQFGWLYLCEHGRSFEEKQLAVKKYGNPI